MNLQTTSMSNVQEAGPARAMLSGRSIRPSLLALGVSPGDLFHSYGFDHFYFDRAHFGLQICV